MAILGLNRKTTIFMIAFAIATGLFFGLREGIIQEDDQINILVMGLDARQGWQARSDSINVVHINSARNRIGILSIPRDTLVDIPGYGWDKINHAHVFGGPELSCLTASRFLNIPIHYYLEINLANFINLIDQIGGVTLDVEKPLYYDDYAGNLHVHLNSGVQHLKGYEVMGYVRFRHDRASDWGRIERQHKFISALANQLLSPSNVWKIPSFLYAASSNIRTNLDALQSLKLGIKISAIYRYGKIDMGVVPGADALLDKGYYMMSDEDGKRKVIDRVIYGKPTNNSMVLNE